VIYYVYKVKKTLIIIEEKNRRNKQMSKPMSENARTVLTYLKENDGKTMNYMDIVTGTGLAAKSVNALVNALVKRGLVERYVIEGSDKKGVKVTFEGQAFDPDATAEA
jgi:DNA-binding MarR family transcriptional regulator